MKVSKFFAKLQITAICTLFYWLVLCGFCTRICVCVRVSVQFFFCVCRREVFEIDFVVVFASIFNGTTAFDWSRLRFTQFFLTVNISPTTRAEEKSSTIYP